MTVPIIVIERLSKKIAWLNKSALILAGEPAENLYGQPISDLLHPRDGFSNSSFLESIEKPEAIAAYLVSNITMSNITGTRVVFNSILQDGYYFLFLKSVASPMHRDMLSTIKEFMIICDAQQRILEITPNGFLAPILQKTSLHMQSISALLNASDIESITNQRAEARQYICEYAKQDIYEWKSSYRDSFTNLSNWTKDENGQFWQKSQDKGHVYTGNNDIGYLYLSKSPELTKCDFSIKCKIKQQKPSRFALVFNQEQPSKWDSSGYSLGINPVENGFAISLKKNARFVKFIIIDSKFDFTLLFHVEKIGARIRLCINEEQLLEYYDESVIDNKFNAFGILSGCGNTILEYEILT
ncbi:MAG: hypothetical protein JNL74_23365, partial [Fibrobacteres bacterium]|nr:hypothetical protein [Fibrobacterota bacterium]